MADSRLGCGRTIHGFAFKTLPTLEEHLQLAHKTYDAVKSQKSQEPAKSQKPAAGVKKCGC